MKKRVTRVLAAAMAAILVWNACEWQPHAWAGSSVYQIEEIEELSEQIQYQEVPYGTKYRDLELPDKLKVRLEEEKADETGEKASPSELAKSEEDEVENAAEVSRKASPSEPDSKSDSGTGAGTDSKKDSDQEADADTAQDGAIWKEVKVRWVLDETFSEKEKYDGETPGTYVFDAELKNSRYELAGGFLPRIEVTVLPKEEGLVLTKIQELDEAIAVQSLPLGAKEADIVLPETLNVSLEHLKEEAGEEICQLSGVTWKLDPEESDRPEFDGGISEKEYFDTFDENGAPVETSEKTWIGYQEANQDVNGCVYVYKPVLPKALEKNLTKAEIDTPEEADTLEQTEVAKRTEGEDQDVMRTAEEDVNSRIETLQEHMKKIEYSEELELPEIYVLVGDAEKMLLANDAPYDLNGEQLIINSQNVNEFNGRTITGTYHETERGKNIEGGIVIDNVSVALTMKDVTIKYGGNCIDNAAGIYLKGNAQLKLTVEGKNELTGNYCSAGIGVEKNATLTITEESDGSLTAIGGGTGGAGIGGRGDNPGSDGVIKSYKTGTIEIRGGKIRAVGGKLQDRYSTEMRGGAGIGTGTYGIGGTIRILGGVVRAEGGKDTGAGIGGGDCGSVDSIQIGGTDGEAPVVEALSAGSRYDGAAIGSGYNTMNGLQLSCGAIEILSGTVAASGNIGYGGITNFNGNSQKGGTVNISEQVKLELTKGTINPRGDACAFGVKTLQLTAYDNQLAAGSYSAHIYFYQENDTERETPVYEKTAIMTVSQFRGTIPEIKEWMGLSGNIQVVVELTDSENNSITETGTAVMTEGKDETVAVTLGAEAYQKTMVLTVYDGRLEDGKMYTLTVRLGKEAEEGGQPDIVTYSHATASGHQITTETESWYSALMGEVPVLVTIREEDSESTYTQAGTLSLKGEEETDLSLVLGEKLYPVDFLFYSPNVEASAQVKLTAKRTDASAQGGQKELKQELGQFVFDGKLVKNTDGGVATAYLPAGEYQFGIETGITNLGNSKGTFTLNQQIVKAEETGTKLLVLNEAAALTEELDLSLGNIVFSEEAGQLMISYYQKDSNSENVTPVCAKGQSYDSRYIIVTSASSDHTLTVDTSASKELKLVWKAVEIFASGDVAPVQINGSSRVTMYLEGDSHILIQREENDPSPAGISVAREAQLTIDSEWDGSLEVVNQSEHQYSGAAIGGDYNQDAGTLIINGGIVIAKLQNKNAYGAYAAAIGSSLNRSVKEIQINGGTVTAEANGSGAGIGTGSITDDNSTRGGKIVISGGTVKATSEKGAGIGSGTGVARNLLVEERNKTQIEIHGGVITAGSSKGASIGSGDSGASSVLIDGGTIELIDSKLSISKSASDIGKGYDDYSYAYTSVVIKGGTFYMIPGKSSSVNRNPVVEGWTQDNTWKKDAPTDGNGNTVYYTKADLTDIYGADAEVKNAQMTGSSYGFKDVKTDSKGMIYMYLPAADKAQAAFDEIVYEGTVEAGKVNELTREPDIVSVDITWGLMDFTYFDGPWDKDTLTYQGGSWKCDTEGENWIRVQNNSNIAIKADYLFSNASSTTVDPEVSQWMSGLSGIFTESAGGTGLPISSQTLKAGRRRQTADSVGQVYFNLSSAKPPKALAQMPLGAVTVRITQPEN